MENNPITKKIIEFIVFFIAIILAFIITTISNGPNWGLAIATFALCAGLLYFIIQNITILKNEEYDIYDCECIDCEKSGYRRQYNKYTFKYNDYAFTILAPGVKKAKENQIYRFYVKKDSKIISNSTVLEWSLKTTDEILQNETNQLK